ncbi:hypothetical protein B0J13DRAFT_541048 [Dactylonectria estremocensis]|uniref:Uncharacterized protein n=1 Tax=Dactylonectria estremocensis TaxID=1079267 RepID=A0A9P9FEM4_9HYPO|nr:hypothetical protein B0J13DRAFT_541048 [Dactylonectria estremocensis]
MINQLPRLQQEDVKQSCLASCSAAMYEASTTYSGSQSSTPDSDNALRPNLRTCSHCSAKFSSQAIKKHLLTHGPTFPCRLNGGPGCGKTFPTAKSRQRHWENACRPAGKMLPPHLCRCGEGVKRWDRFKKHTSQCISSKHQLGGTQHTCYCSAQFETWPEMKAHYESTHQKSAGRPKKNSTSRMCNARGRR